MTGMFTDMLLNTWNLITSPEYLKIILIIIIFAIFVRIINELKYIMRYGHSSGSFERLFSFGRSLFKIKNNFFTVSEEKFYKNLKEVLYELFQYRYDVYPKTRLNDIFDTRYSKDWFMKSHVDFLIVDKYQNFKPVLGIEIDGDSHDYWWQRRSDKFKNKVFLEAGLPLERIKNEQVDNIKIIYAIAYKYLKK